MQSENTCGECPAYHLGILEVYCHRLNVNRNPDDKACRHFGEETAKYARTKKSNIMKEEKENTQEPVTDKGAVRIHNAAKSLKTNAATIREAIKALGVELVVVGEGNRRQRAVPREHMDAIHKYIAENNMNTETKSNEIDKDEQDKIHKTISEGRWDKKPETKSDTRTRLVSVSDEKLVAELRARGYTVKCTKQITIEL